MRVIINPFTSTVNIARLESYYGATLFYRKPHLMLTPAGEYVLSSANTILKEESNLKDILFDVEQQERGLLRFGASTLRMNTSLPRILPKFSERYPKVELRLTDTISSELIELVISGQLDLALTVVKKDDPRLIETHLLEDQVYLCVSDVLLKKYYGETQAAALKQKSANGASVADFAKLPFCLLQNRIGELIYECFSEAHVTPWPYITSTYTSISAAICFDRLAASFIPRVCLADLQSSIPEDINIFPIIYKGKPLTQHVYLIHMKDRYMPRPFQYFQTLLSEYYRDVECVGLERIV